MNDKDIKSLSIFGFIAFFLKERSLKSATTLKVSTLILHFVCNVLLQNQDDFRSFCRPKRHSCNFWSICCCTNLWRSMISNGTTGVTYDWNDPSSLGSNCFPKCSENLLSSQENWLSWSEWGRIKHYSNFFLKTKYYCNFPFNMKYEYKQKTLNFLLWKRDLQFCH